MRTVRFRLADRVLLRCHGDGYSGVDVFVLKASKFFAGFAPAGAKALFFAPPKKSTQRKAARRLARLLIFNE